MGSLLPALCMDAASCQTLVTPIWVLSCVNRVLKESVVWSVNHHLFEGRTMLYCATTGISRDINSLTDNTH